MTLPYEILIRSNDGKYSGAHVLDTSTSSPRAIQESDWPEFVKEINQAAITEADSIKATESAKLAAAQAQIVDLQAIIEAGKATLAEHQAISDDLASRAEKAMAEGDVSALPAIIADAKVYGQAREKKKLLEEFAALEKQADDIEAKALEIKARAEAISVN